MEPMRMSFVFLAVTIGIVSAGNLRALNGQCELFCSRVTLTLIDVDAMGGTFNTLASILPEMTAAEAKDLRPYLTLDPATNESLVVVDNISTGQATLFVFSESAKNVTHTVSFSDAYQKQPFNSLFYDAAGGRLLATFGNLLTSIDRQTGTIATVLQMYDNTKFEVGPASVSGFDPISNRYFTSALEAVDMQCFYLFGANLTDQSVDQSACIPNPATSAGVLVPTQLQPYNGTALASVWLNQQVGVAVDLMDPVSIQLTEVLGSAEFNRLGWSIGNYNPLAYDRGDNVIWMYIFDGQDYRFVRLNTNGQYTLGGKVKLPNVLNMVYFG